MPDTVKTRRYAALVRDRKKCRRCIGLRNPAEAELAKFDSNLIGPWTRLHGDLDAELMIIGQDWGDVRYFSKNSGLDDLKNPTMRTLERLLRGIGVNAVLSEYGTDNSGIFLTNAVLCLKDGGLQGVVQRPWFSNCGSFLRRQIEIVSPKVVVTLGQRAHEATIESWGLTPTRFRAAVDDPDGVLLPNGSQLIAVYHCGNRILNTHRPFADQKRDWKRVKRALSRARSA